jgi:hypothetical protein
LKVNVAHIARLERPYHPQQDIKIARPFPDDSGYLSGIERPGFSALLKASPQGSGNLTDNDTSRIKRDELVKWEADVGPPECEGQ